MRVRSTFFLFLVTYTFSCSNYVDGNFPAVPQPHSEKDSVIKKKAFGTLKFDPLQVILSCEIPVSLEIYLSQQLSLQVQAGYIFPARENSMRRGIYESYGENGNASTYAMFYYRNCPYNNDGSFDIKTELRLFFKPIGTDRNYQYKSSYFAFQCMYKYCYYDNLSVYLGSPFSYEQTESKKANIYGFALIFGKQKYRVHSLVTDLYGGIGFKTSKINYKILGISPPQPPWFPKKPGQTGSESIFSLYLCFGIRIGFEF